MIVKRLFNLFLLVGAAAFSQELMTLQNSKTYPATPTWDFICENYALTGSAKIQIAKNEKGGLLKITVETSNNTFIIAGTAYLFLMNNETITCTDKGIREISGTQISSYYSLAAVEMNRLKHTEIQSIHFNIKGKTTGFSSQIGNFTAVNKIKYFATAYDASKKSYDTSQQIKALYP